MLKLLKVDYDKVKELYLTGNSAQEIKDTLELDVTVRQLQRKLASEGLTRSPKQAYNLAITKGRMKWDWDHKRAWSKAERTIIRKHNQS